MLACPLNSTLGNSKLISSERSNKSPMLVFPSELISIMDVVGVFVFKLLPTL